jgi:hypothetical protein
MEYNYTKIIEAGVASFQLENTSFAVIFGQTAFNMHMYHRILGISFNLCVENVIDLGSFFWSISRNGFRFLKLTLIKMNV